jgi:DNA-binding NtrC family response regulator
MDKSYTMLIIEDDSQFRLTLKAYFEDSNYTIFEAGDGLEGMEIYSRLKPDIVLTDLRMPKLDGFGVITAIKTKNPGTPVIVFTGTRDPMAKNNALRLGAFECLFKPIESLSILEAVIVKALEEADNYSA